MGYILCFIAGYFIGMAVKSLPQEEEEFEDA